MKFSFASGIYWGLSIRNFIQIHSDLTFLLYNIYVFTFLVYNQFISAPRHKFLMRCSVDISEKQKGSVLSGVQKCHWRESHLSESSEYSITDIRLGHWK